MNIGILTLSVVTNIQRTQFKSNSQLGFAAVPQLPSCYQYSKNTI